MGFTCLKARATSSFEEAVYFLPLSSQNFLVLFYQPESTLEQPKGFEEGTPGLGNSSFSGKNEYILPRKEVHAEIQEQKRRENVFKVLNF